MSRPLPSSKKVHSEQHKQILKQLLKEPANKTCVDCKTSKNPRWASWNLGCFVCIRCSGIHRSMGTHISKVKSVDLDAWTDEQIESMVKWGNEKSNLFWEAKLPDDYIPNELKIENFIRTKYDLKKWAGSTVVPNPSSISVAHKAPVEPVKEIVKEAAPIKNLFDDDFGSFTTSPSPILEEKKQPIRQNNLRAPQSAQSTGGLLNAPQSTGGSMNGRPDLKKSILSLYSSPSSSLSFVDRQSQANSHTANNFPTGNNFQVANTSNQSAANSFNTNTSNQSAASSFNANTSNQSAANSFNFQGTSNYNRTNGAAPPAVNKTSLPAANVANLSNSLLGLSFGNGTYNTAPAAAPVAATKSKWNNEWDDANQWNLTPTPPVAQTSSIGLDDDLFKNEWR